MKAIVTKFRPCTNAKGSHILARCEGGSIRVSYDHGLDSSGNHAAACVALMKKMGWTGRMRGGCLPDGKSYCFVFVSLNAHGANAEF